METVLIVEDDEDIAALLEFKLRNSGYKVVVAENGKLGLDAARIDPPDLIILDVMMPVMNGLEALQILKSDVELSSIPVIVLTAQSKESEIVKCLELGADDYITKPFRTQEFATRVQAVLRRCKRPSIVLQERT